MESSTDVLVIDPIRDVDGYVKRAKSEMLSPWRSKYNFLYTF